MANDVYRAVNIAILGKIFDTYGIKASTFARWMNLSESSIKKIKAVDTTVAKTWNYEEVAEELRMDPRVFTGDYLLRIGTENVKNLCEGMFTSDGDSYYEWDLWQTIVDYRDNKDADIRKNGKRLQTMLLDEVGKQAKEEHFEDLQLWKFWDYIRKNRE